MRSVAVVVSTYNKPRHLARCLLALALQVFTPFEIVIADDGSDRRTRAVLQQFEADHGRSVTHVWQEDRGFRKTRILNRAVCATRSEYLVFIDGDCVAHPDFLQAHLARAEPGFYLAGSMIRLNRRLTEAITAESIRRGDAFHPNWLIARGHSLDRRYLRLSLAGRTCRWLDGHTSTRPHWLGCNSSCFRSDLVAVNGFDQRFTYGFEDADFGNRLENSGVRGRNVRWTANVLHLFHGRPYVQEGMRERNLALVSPRGSDGWVRAPDGYDQLADDRQREPSVVFAHEAPG